MGLCAPRLEILRTVLLATTHAWGVGAAEDRHLLTLQLRRNDTHHATAAVVFK